MLLGNEDSQLTVYPAMGIGETICDPRHPVRGYPYEPPERPNAVVVIAFRSLGAQQSGPVSRSMVPMPEGDPVWQAVPCLDGTLAL